MGRLQQMKRFMSAMCHPLMLMKKDIVQGARSVETLQVKDSPQQTWGNFGTNFGFQGPVVFAMLLGGEQPFMAFGSRKELLDGHHHRKLHVQLGLFAPDL